MQHSGMLKQAQHFGMLQHSYDLQTHRSRACCLRDAHRPVSIYCRLRPNLTTVSPPDRLSPEPKRKHYAGHMHLPGEPYRFNCNRLWTVQANAAFCEHKPCIAAALHTLQTRAATVATT